jgi:flagellar motor switch protein FliG
LHQLPAPVLADLLSREHPQAIAAVIYDLEDGFAAQVLKLLPKDTIVEVVKRVAQLSSVPREAIKEVEEVLLSSLGAPTPASEVASGVAKAAALLNGLDGEEASELLTQIAAADSRLADAVRDARFTIEDLLSADDRGLQQLLREVENQKLLLALKTASETLRDKFLGCVSTRVAESIRSELATMGPVRLRDVEGAQREIVEVALRLQKDGKLMLAGQSGDPLV